MLQREMDNTADYGIPTIKPKKGFFQKLFEKIGIRSNQTENEKMTEGVKVDFSKKRGLKWLAQLGLPIQIISIIALGTLLGAAYAVTLQNDARYMVVAPQQQVLYKKENQKNIFLKKDRDLKRQVAITKPNNVIIKQGVSKNTGSGETIEPALSEFEKEKIRKLEAKILQIKQETEDVDLSNARLKVKLELLVGKNRALSDQLRYIHYQTDRLEKK